MESPDIPSHLRISAVLCGSDGVSWNGTDQATKGMTMVDDAS